MSEGSVSNDNDTMPGHRQWHLDASRGVDGQCCVRRFRICETRGAGRPGLRSPGMGSMETSQYVYVVADDMGWGDVGIHGCSDIKTPTHSPGARQVGRR